MFECKRLIMNSFTNFVGSEEPVAGNFVPEMNLFAPAEVIANPIPPFGSFTLKEMNPVLANDCFPENSFHISMNFSPERDPFSSIRIGVPNSASSSLVLFPQQVEPTQNGLSFAKFIENSRENPETCTIDIPLQSEPKRLKANFEKKRSEDRETCVASERSGKKASTGNDLAQLKKLLCSLWTGEKKNFERMLEELSPHEKNILNKILSRKLSLGKSSLSLLQKLEAVEAQKNSKRLEERLKFVIKRVIKSMIEGFHKLEKGHRKQGKKDNFFNFFRFHFGEIAERERIPIEQFILPQSIPRCPKIFKTFSSEYITLLRKSPKFIESFCTEMKKVEKESLSSLAGKIGRFLSGLSKKGSSRDSFESFNLFFEWDCKSKLPWTSREISDAFDQVQSMLT